MLARVADQRQPFLRVRLPLGVGKFEVHHQQIGRNKGQAVHRVPRIDGDVHLVTRRFQQHLTHPQLRGIVVGDQNSRHRCHPRVSSCRVCLRASAPRCVRSFPHLRRRGQHG